MGSRSNVDATANLRLGLTRSVQAMTGRTRTCPSRPMISSATAATRDVHCRAVGELLHVLFCIRTAGNHRTPRIRVGGQYSLVEPYSAPLIQRWKQILTYNDRPGRSRIGEQAVTTLSRLNWHARLRCLTTRHPRRPGLLGAASATSARLVTGRSGLARIVFQGQVQPASIARRIMSARQQGAWRVRWGWV